MQANTKKNTEIAGQNGVKYEIGYETGYETGMKPFGQPRLENSAKVWAHVLARSSSTSSSSSSSNNNSAGTQIKEVVVVVGSSSSTVVVLIIIAIGILVLVAIMIIKGLKGVKYENWCETGYETGMKPFGPRGRQGWGTRSRL